MLKDGGARPVGITDFFWDALSMEHPSTFQLHPSRKEVWTNRHRIDLETFTPQPSPAVLLGLKDIRSFRLDDSGALCAVLHDNGKIKVIDTQTNRIVLERDLKPASFPTGKGSVASEVALSSKAGLLAAAGAGTMIQVWDLKTGNEVYCYAYPDMLTARLNTPRESRLSESEHTGYCVGFSPDGSKLAYGRKNLITVLETKTWTPRKKIKCEGGLVRQVAIRDDGTVVAFQDGSLLKVGPEATAQIQRVPGTWTSFTLARGGKWLVGLSSKLVVLDLATFTPLADFQITEPQFLFLASDGDSFCWYGSFNRMVDKQIQVRTLILKQDKTLEDIWGR